MKKPKIILVLGPPGSGKGTQCEKIEKLFGFTHLSSGQLLRDECAKERSQFKAELSECFESFKMAPVEITVSLLKARILNTIEESSNDKFIIDGFPRDCDNLRGWQRLMAEDVDFLFVLYFNCSHENSAKRCLIRGLAGSGRADDNSERLKYRLDSFMKNTVPVIDHFRSLGKVKQIDTNETVEVVFNDVQTILLEAQNQGLFCTDVNNTK